MEKFNQKFYNDALTNIEKLTNKPELFLSSNNDLTNELKIELKKFYDFSKSQEDKNLKSNALPTLIIKDMDLEQIWQQIELQNEELVEKSLESVSKFVGSKNKLLFKNFENLQSASDSGGEEEQEDEEKGEADYTNNDEDMKNESDDSDDDNVSLNDEHLQNKNDSVNKKFKSSEVDDEFFKLNEMENYLLSEEKKLNEPDSRNDSADSDSEDSVDLFENQLDNYDDDENDEDGGKTAKYKDFFVEKEVVPKKPKRNKLFEEDEKDNDKDENDKSMFELRQERLSKTINELEEKAIGKKPWQLKGEVTGEDRPLNSLLEEIVEYDVTNRPAPVMTEKVNLRLEDIIKQRIRDKAFDNPQRKQKPVDIPLDYKKKLLLNQEKSKESLAEVYEKEYLKTKEALDPENENKEEEIPQYVKDIDLQLNSLFLELDALSNFYFTPKPAIPETRIINNLPAINMEEVAPVAVSNAALLAPEEVKRKTKGEILDKNERTATDKKRERRKKKNKQRNEAKKRAQREKLINKLKPGLGNKYSKEKATKMLENAAKSSNVDLMDQSLSTKQLKSSKAFFSELQSETQSQIASKLKKRKKDNNKSISAKKIKL